MDIAQLISNVGFPIFSFIVTGLACKYVYDKESQKNAETTERFTELSSAINHNSESILRLCDKLDFEEKEDDGK